MPKWTVEQAIDMDLYAYIRRAADLFNEHIREDKVPGVAELNFELNKNLSINPTQQQTETGFFAYLEGGILIGFYGPCGFWWVRGGGFRIGDTDDIMRRYLAKLGINVPEGQRPQNMYPVVEVDGHRLPPATWRQPADYIPFEIASRAWERMGRAYAKTKK